MYYYIADTHFYSSYYITHMGRPFRNVYEMNEVIARNWRARVTNRDRVYFLGDVGSQRHPEVVDLVKNLPGEKVLIIGNHDTAAVHRPEFRHLFLYTAETKNITDQGRLVHMCHYPCTELDPLPPNEYHLYGHVHYHDEHLRKYRNMFNVGVDRTNWSPVTLDELIAGSRTRR